MAIGNYTAASHRMGAHGAWPDPKCGLCKAEAEHRAKPDCPHCNGTGKAR